MSCQWYELHYDTNNCNSYCPQFYCILYKFLLHLIFCMIIEDGVRYPSVIFLNVLSNTYLQIGDDNTVKSKGVCFL
jgi:hypothetical protein